jgi:hypothetical protein
MKPAGQLVLVREKLNLLPNPEVIEFKNWAAAFIISSTAGLRDGVTL